MNAHARLTDPATSHEAAETATRSVAASQAAVRHILVAADLEGRHAVTDREIEAYAELLGYQFSPSRLRTARGELEHMGVVHAAGTVKPEGRRTRMTLWALAEAVA